MYKKKKMTKYLRSSHVDGKRENSLFSRRNGNQQPANAKNGGKIVVTWSFLPFAFHDAKSL